MAKASLFFLFLDTVNNSLFIAFIKINFVLYFVFVYFSPDLFPRRKTKRSNNRVGVFAYFAVVFIYSGTFEAAKKLHNDLFHVILRGSVCRFFDITPIGRLLNHFSGDMETIDTELPGTLDSFLTFIFLVLNFYFCFLQIFFSLLVCITLFFVFFFLKFHQLLFKSETMQTVIISLPKKN